MRVFLSLLYDVHLLLASILQLVENSVPALWVITRLGEMHVCHSPKYCMVTIKRDLLVDPSDFCLSILVSFEQRYVTSMPMQLFDDIHIVCPMNFLSIIQVHVFQLRPDFQDTFMSITNIVNVTLCPAIWSETFDIPGQFCFMPWRLLSYSQTTSWPVSPFI